MKQFNLADWALRHKSIIYFFMAMLFAIGSFSFMKIGRMEDPNFTIRTMVVAATWPGASPQQMSEQVTDKLEEKIRDLSGLDYTKSFTDGGKTVIYINLKESVKSDDVRAAWTEVRHMIDDEWSSLPSGVQGPVINDRFDDVYGTIYALTGDDYSYEEKRAYAEDIKRVLLSVPNVKRIDLKGVQEQTLYVEMNKDKLSAYQISAQTILNALKQQSSMAPAGMIDTDTNNVYLRVNGLFDSVDSVREMPLQVNGQTLRLGDIATVRMDYESPQSPLFYYNGKPAIGIAVSMDPGANNIEFGKALDAKMASYKDALPAGLDVSQVSNQPKVVDDSISEFTRSLFEAIVIVLIVSFISLGVRSGIVVALTIPVVVASTFVGMYADGLELHKVSLGALIISLGLLVDDAIIVVEMMTLKMEEGLNTHDAATFAYKSTAFPMLSGTLITCCGFLPIFLSEGSVAEFTHALFIVVAMALLLSWFASVLVSPVLGSKLIRIKPGHEETRAMRIQKAFLARFEKFLHWALGHRRTVLITTLVLFFISLVSVPLIKVEFFPASTRPEIMVAIQFPQSSSLQYTKEQAEQLDNLLSGDKRIEHYSSYIGEGAPRFVLTLEPEVQRNNYMQYVIVANSLEDRNSLYNELNEKLKDEFPSALINMDFIQTGPPSKYPIMFRVSGPDMDKVKEIATDVKAVFKEYPEITDIAEDWPDNTPNIEVHIDPSKARLMGVDSYTVATDLQSKISGITVGQYYVGNQTIPMKFKLSGNEDHNMSVLQNIPIQTGSGAYVPLSQIATISLGNEDGIIWHRNMAPTITVHGNVPPNVMADSLANEINEKLDTMRADLPAGYTIEVDGSAEQSNIALNNLKGPMPIMICLIMVILMFQLKKISLMIMAMLTAPLGLIGVVLTMLLTNTPMGFMVVLGVISLSGMIIRNSIILIDQIELHRKEGQTTYEAIVSSTILRFRPIMLTALAAILGMVPLMRSAFWSPMAIAFSGGLFVATILTLIVLPVMYAVYFKAEEK